MPTLDFKGKQFIYSHHLSVPFRELLVDNDRSLPSAGNKPSLDDNLVIHGDNLEALKALLPTHAGKIDCIYIDPPYNTGEEGWCYNDNVRSPLMKEWLKVSANPVDKDDLERHDKWLCMMWPRLHLLRELLAEDGAIFISIDDNEIHHLRALLDEIFGEDNSLAILVWEKGKKGDSIFFSRTHEYVLVYAKNKILLVAQGTKWRIEKEGAEEILAYYNKLIKKHGKNHGKTREAMMAWYRSLKADDPAKSLKQYNWSDDRGLYFPDNFAGPDDGRKNRPRHDIIHPITGNPCAKPSTGWRWDAARTARALEATPRLIHFGLDETTIPCRKTYLKNVTGDALHTVFYKDGRAATLELEQIIGKGVFPFPKDVEILMRFLSACTDENSVILDSFAGSGTTAHAVLQLNNLDGGTRRFILIQLPEPTEEESKAKAAGYNDVIDITVDRVSKVIHGYDFTGTKKLVLSTEKLIWSKFERNPNEIVDRVHSIENFEGSSYDRVLKEINNGVITVIGEKKVAEATPSLGGSFTFCTLGEPIQIAKLLDGSGLPNYETLAQYVFYTATGQSLDTAVQPDDSGFVGETELFRVHLFYKPDISWLRMNEAALNVEKVARVIQSNTSGKRAIVFAVAKFMSQKELTSQHIEFCQLPYAVHRILGD